MKYLYAPWREQYVVQGADQMKNGDSPDTCVFCTQIAEKEDEKNFILARYQEHIIILNKYPYNSGHLMVIPYKHVSDLTYLHEDERASLIELTNTCLTIVKSELSAQGANVGFNFGAVAGGSFPHHLHMHVVPRWQGDTNFLPLLAQTKQISVDLVSVYKKLKAAFAAI